MVIERVSISHTEYSGDCFLCSESLEQKLKVGTPLFIEFRGFVLFGSNSIKPFVFFIFSDNTQLFQSLLEVRSWSQGPISPHKNTLGGSFLDTFTIQNHMNQDDF